jgi:hypothetical protein
MVGRCGACVLAVACTTGCYEGVDARDSAAEGDASESATEGEGGHEGGDDPGDIPEVGCDGLRPGRAPLRRMSDVQYRNTIGDLFAGAVSASDDFPPTSAAFAFSSEPDANLVTDLAAEQILMAAEDVGDQVIAAVAEVAPCDADELSCAAAFVDAFGPRAFRRPLHDDERERLLAVYQDAAAEGGYADGIGRVVTVALQLPAFLYFVEEGVATDDDTVRLGDHEIATRLSYLLWDTMPDDELRELADAGELHDVDAIEAQTRRLLADPRSAAALTRFHREWLGVRQLRAADKDAEAFPQFGADLIASMDAQLERFVAARYVDDEPTLARMLTASEVDVDALLAPLLGVAAPADWTTVELDASRRAGIFTLPAFLGAHASTERTSAVHRGKLLRTRVLCQPIPPPPPEAMAMGSELPEDATEAQRTQALLDNPACGSCHVLMNPLGMSFEHYDAIGAWRDTYADGRAIETRWDLVSPPEGLESASFDGAVELSHLLAGASPIGDCYVENWVHHGFGTEPGDSEVAQCALDDLTAAFDASGQNLPELVVALTRSDAFRFRDISEETDP